MSHDAASDGSAAYVVHRRFTKLLTELERCEPLVRYGAPESIHRMRVAARRLRNALASYRPLLDRQTTNRLRRELEWLTSELGEPRDVEVLHGRLRELLAEEPPDLVRGGVVAFVDRTMTDRWRSAQDSLIRALASPRYLALLEDLRGLVAEPPWSAPARQPAQEVLSGRLRHDLKRLERQIVAADAAGEPDERAARLHDVRKAAKRVRYAAEPLVPLYGKQARRLVATAEDIQSVLGTHQDAVVAQAELMRLAEAATAEGEDPFTLGILHTREEARAAGSAKEFAQLWKVARRKNRHRWPD
ncbi:MAG: domain containing protein [Marmoricola sp.]|jgi:CHAD domain-containing protein|nr:domain containing protein [Marmoricola sp.]